MTKRSNISTLLLILAAAAIWGVVGYRVYRWVAPVEAPAVKPAAPKERRQKPARDSLLLNYPDPFLGEVKKAKEPAPRTPSMPMPERPMPGIAYKGLIRDADGSLKAMITYNNQTDGYRKGETIEGIKIKQITAECITVRWNGSDYTIAAK